MIPKFKAAMFDMDGTLLCSMRYWRLTTIELLLGRDIIPTPEQMTRVFNTSSRALCKEILHEHGIDMDDMAILRELEYYMHHHYTQDAKAKPNVHAYLDKLHQAGIPHVHCDGGTQGVCPGSPEPSEAGGLFRIYHRLLRAGDAQGQS